MNNVKSGSVEGTGAALTIELGWQPDYVKVQNIDDSGTLFARLEWYAALPDAYAIKYIGGSTTVAKLTSLGITPYAGAATFALTGTVAVTAGSPTITGTSTEFTTEVDKGDILQIDDTGEEYLVREIVSDTVIVASQNVTTTDSSSAVTNKSGRKPGFIIGADTDLNVNAETICWFASRNAEPV